MSRDRFADILESVLRILNGMGIDRASADAVIAAPPFYDGSVLLTSRGLFDRFNGQIAYTLRFVGYPFEEVAFLTVGQLCEMYVRDSFPEAPSTPLSNDQYELDIGPFSRGPAGARRDFPICFVLGAPRSGTTLFRAMLNLHAGLWAPGELHLAHFATMADRARNVGPVLRYMPIPEIAARLGAPVAACSRTFRSWELAATPTTEVFQSLYDADPDAMIADKSPPYCVRRETLERIGDRFPNARFVHLIRSPHDMIRSYVRMQLHRGDHRVAEPGRNPYQMGEAIWYACNANARAFLAGVPEERKCEVRYEALVADPSQSLHRVCELLGRPFDPQMADPYAGATEPIAQGAGDLHIHLLERVEQRTPIEAFYPLGGRCQRLAEYYGY